MPYANIRIMREGTTAKRKGQRIGGATEVLPRVLSTYPATPFAIIEGVDTNNCGISGETVAVRHRETAVERAAATGVRP